jgi:hypothetical protein
MKSEFMDLVINKDILYTYGDFQTEFFTKELFESNDLADDLSDF